MKTIMICSVGPARMRLYTSSKKLLPLTVFAIAVTSLFCVRPAQAFTVTLEQVGANVVANGSGAFDLTGLTFVGSQVGQGGFFVIPNQGVIVLGSGTSGLSQDIYTGFAGPTAFGSGSGANADTGSGDTLAIADSVGLLFVPQGYMSGAPLSDTITFDNATFASLGVMPGTYVWSWGTGVNQNFTLIIGRAEPTPRPRPTRHPRPVPN